MVSIRYTHVVVYVSDDGVAQRSGLAVGDILVSANRKDLAPLDHAGMIRVLTQGESETVEQ